MQVYDLHVKQKSMSCFPAKSLEVAVKFLEETWHNKILYTFMLTTRDAGGELTTSAHLLAYMHASIHIIISSVFWVDLMTQNKQNLHP